MRGLKVSVQAASLLVAFLFSSASPAVQTYVMMPLTQIRDWNAFHQQLQTLRKNGVEGVTTDVWWGLFEAEADNRFDWRYFRNYADVVRSAGLKWTPILSFHQCGGNVGDDCNIPLPSWIWNLGTSDEMLYRDVDGYLNPEYIAPWFQPVYSQYGEALESFGENFRDYADIIPKIYISMGPAGELRYPSYNGAAGWNYPQSGKIQAHSPIAIEAFRKAMREKYSQSLSKLNEAWGTSIDRWSIVGPPTDGDQFFINGVKLPYGRDFMTWYQSILITHMEKMMREVRLHLTPKLPTRIGAKISGVHWLYNSPWMPHAGEYAAGYMEYRSILNKMSELGIDLTFTCLELEDQNRDPFYSSPQGLVQEVASMARDLKLPINGENALPIQGNRRAYENIQRNLVNFSFKAFTLLRLNNIVDDQGREKPEMTNFRDLVIRSAKIKEMDFFDFLDPWPQQSFPRDGSQDFPF
jgi:beta-amylase